MNISFKVTSFQNLSFLQSVILTSYIVYTARTRKKKVTVHVFDAQTVGGGGCLLTNPIILAWPTLSSPRHHALILSLDVLTTTVHTRTCFFSEDGKKIQYAQGSENILYG